MSGLQLLSPAALVALIPLAGAIILMYLLRLRRRDLTVPSVFLWRQAIDDVQANAPFQKLRRNLLMILQLLALLLLVLALAGPYTLTRRLGGKTVVILLDASASMKATDESPSRFEKARAHAAQIIGSMGRDDEAALVVCGSRAWVAHPFSTDRQGLLKALEGLSPGDTATNMRDGILLALSLASNRAAPRVYVLSDGAFPPPGAVSGSADVRFVRVGKGNNNAAILALETTSGEAGATQLFIRLRNGETPRAGLLSVYLGEDLLDTERIRMVAGESAVRTYDLTAPEPGLIRAQFEVDDDLAVDNVAYTYSSPADRTRVLLVTRGNLFLEQCLLVQPDVEVFRLTGTVAPTTEEEFNKYDVVIFDRVEPVLLPARRPVLLIDCGGPGAPGEPGGALSAPAITRWERNHPVCRYVNLAPVQIAQARELTLSPSAEPLVWAREAPLIAAETRPGSRRLSIGFALDDTDLPLRVSFPVLIGNCLRWLTEESRSTDVRIVRPGEVLRLPAGPGVSKGMLTRPEGARSVVQAADGQILLADLNSVGTYSVTAGEDTFRWAADLRSAPESDLTPGAELKLGEQTVGANTELPRTEDHWWPWLALVGLVVLLGEWHLYHRRY